MKKKWILSLLLSFTVWAAEIPSLKPLTDHLKTLPATVTGEIFVKKPLSLKNDDVAKITLKPDKNLYFGVDDKGLSINFAGAISMCVKTIVDIVDGCKAVEVRNVSWSPEKGFDSQLYVPNWDIFGMIESKTKKELEKTLNERFGAKMMKAHTALKTIRQSKDLKDVQKVANTLGEVFYDEIHSGGGGPKMEFGGRIGLEFYEGRKDVKGNCDFGIPIGQMRVGIPCNDRISTSIGFYRDENGARLKQFRIDSEKGININEGIEFAMNKRIVLNHLNLDSDGVASQLHVGASETILGIIALFQVGGAAMGIPPSQVCHSCELAKLPSFTSEADLMMRKKIYDLVKEHKSELPGYGVDAETLKFFMISEQCKIHGLECQQPCFGRDNKDACLDSCAEKYRQCGGGH